MAVKSVHVTVRGIVQGVGYRAFVEREAVARDLSGWVRNRRDGSVEAVVSGPSETVDSLLALCRSGPRLARIVDIEITDCRPPSEGPFQVLPSF